MANNLITISQVTNEGLMVLENDLCFADHVNRQYAEQFALSGAKIGYTVNVRKPLVTLVRRVRRSTSRTRTRPISRSH